MASNNAQQSAAAGDLPAAPTAAAANAGPAAAMLDPELFMAARRGYIDRLTELLQLNDDHGGDDQAGTVEPTAVAVAAAQQVVVEVDALSGAGAAAAVDPTVVAVAVGAEQQVIEEVDPRPAAPMDPTVMAAAQVVVVDAPAAPSSLLHLLDGVTSNEGNSLLHVVAAAGDAGEFHDCAKMIYHGKNGLLIARNNKGDTPLHRAAAAGNANMVSILVTLARSGGDTTATDLLRMRNECGETALHQAVRAASIACIDNLMSEDSELACIPLEDGASPLYLAISLGDMEIARHLLDHSDRTRGKLSYSGLDGQNVLHAAVFHVQENPRSLIHSSLQFVGAPCGGSRPDLLSEKHFLKNDINKVSKHLTDAAQVMGFVSVLVATVTFASAFTLPGGYYQSGSNNAGAALLAGSYAFDAFIISDTLAFICSCIATFSLIFAGVPAMDISIRLWYFEISAMLLRSSGRSLVVAFALGLYLVLAPVAHTTGIVVCVIISISSLYGNSEAWQTVAVANTARARMGTRMPIAWTCVIMFYNVFGSTLVHFWSFVIIFGLPAIWN
ncbi:hypothetical protein ACP70R_042062 [Stipagrostis hirtigluma subsp. patula]